MLDNVRELQGKKDLKLFFEHDTSSMIYKQKVLLEEEVKEFSEAVGIQDIPNSIKECLDVVYAAFSFLTGIGLSNQAIHDLWTLVHNSNMQKEPASKLIPSKRGHISGDLVKPKNWQEPAIKDWVQENKNSFSELVMYWIEEGM